MTDRAAMKRQIAEQKLKAFSIGAMGAKRSLSKKEQEEQKRKEQDAAAAVAFEEFIATFQETPSSKTNKVWVKAGTYDAGKRREDTSERGKLYKPQSRLGDSDKGNTADKAEEYARYLGNRSSDSQRPKKKNEKEKKKSNLELFKEELKMIQEEREERHKYKSVIKNSGSGGNFNDAHETSTTASSFQEETKGSFDCGDPTTTNLYLGNLNPKITEQQLMELFGRYGPLASIKIMWPRSDEEKARGRNCGFVAFMNRKDGERALKYLNGKDIQSYEMKLGWGKSVPIPSYPIYIPPKMLELTIPPPHSGLPFNAQPPIKDRHKIPRPRPGEPLSEEDKKRLDEILSQAYVKVVVPTDRTLLLTIHRVVEFVVREGPMFEAMIMNKEINNPSYRFLFENQTPAHIYYRWKMFSILQGDQPKEWRTADFRMFKNGSVWRPPPMNLFTQGMSDDLVEEELDTKTKGTLSNSQRNRLEDFLRHLTPERMKIAEVMVFCMEHSDAAEEICECIMESLTNSSTTLHKKIARLYLVSDILHNCGIKIQNASFYRRGFESRLVRIFTDIRAMFTNLESRLQAEGLRTRVMQVFRAWEDWAMYPKDFLIKLQNIFLGLSDAAPPAMANDENGTDEDLDGAPLSDVDGEDLDGVPLDGAALMKSLQSKNNAAAAAAAAASAAVSRLDDIDGVPLVDEDDEDLDGVPMDQDEKSKKATFERSAAFVPSKWETVEEEEATAMDGGGDDDEEEEGSGTLSKWDDLELSEPLPSSANDRSVGNKSRQDFSSERRVDTSEDDKISLDDRDGGVGDVDDRRAKLREVEVKVMQYQDELESGKRSVKAGWTLAQQVQHYRKKLIRKSDRGVAVVGGDKKEVIKPDRNEKRKDRSLSPISPPNNWDYAQSRKRKGRSESGSPPVRKTHRSRSDSYSPPSRKQKSPSYRSSDRKYNASPSPPPSSSTTPSSSSRHKRKHAASPSPPRYSSKYAASSPSPPPKHSSSASKYSRSPPSSRSFKHSKRSSPVQASPVRKHKHKHKH